MLASCSAVFKANLGGKVRDVESDAGIANMSIFAYTNTTQRDNDWESYTGGTFNPSNVAGYVARTTSDNDGSFVINKIIWESTLPEFGKTADYKEIALLFYHEDYGLHKNSNSVWITSDSTNVSMVDEKFGKINQTTNIRVYLRDAATDNLINESFDVILKVEQEPGDPEPKVERSTISGTGTVGVTYPVALDSTKVSATATLQNSTWMQCDKEGALIANNAPPSFTVSGNNSEITLYLKQSRHAYPLISGEIDSEDRDGSEIVSPDDGLTIWLGERNSDGKIVLFDKPGAQTMTRSEGTGANNSVIRHGLFTNLGANMIWEEDTYVGPFDTKEILLVVDIDKNRELSAGDYYYEFSIIGNQESKELGRLRSYEVDPNDNELKEVVAGDLL
ncbi:MAG: hypothetical protein GX842_03950 [Spirochaetales bacterium]|nr:hypothetical protein [Spirochaetales bacterium]